MKKKIDNNSGYTLVELIIVLAIIVILTTAAFVTMSIMHTAKVKEAAKEEVFSLSLVPYAGRYTQRGGSK